MQLLCTRWRRIGGAPVSGADPGHESVPRNGQLAATAFDRIRGGLLFSSRAPPPTGGRTSGAPARHYRAQAQPA